MQLFLDFLFNDDLKGPELEKLQDFKRILALVLYPSYNIDLNALLEENTQEQAHMKRIYEFLCTGNGSLVDAYTRKLYAPLKSMYEKEYEEYCFSGAVTDLPENGAYSIFVMSRILGAHINAPASSEFYRMMLEKLSTGFGFELSNMDKRFLKALESDWGWWHV